MPIASGYQSSAVRQQQRQGSQGGGALPRRPRQAAAQACQQCVREQAPVLLRLPHRRQRVQHEQHRLTPRPAPATKRNVEHEPVITPVTALPSLGQQQQPGEGKSIELLPLPQHQEQQQELEQQDTQQVEDNPAVQAALAALRFYKAAISPLLPPSCRYIPTCSSYAMDAFSGYGFLRGGVLTAWRLLRCAPWGRGDRYDPVRWPPPGLEFLFPQ